MRKVETSAPTTRSSADAESELKHARREHKVAIDAKNGVARMLLSAENANAAQGLVRTRR